MLFHWKVLQCYMKSQNSNSDFFLYTTFDSRLGTKSFHKKIRWFNEFKRLVVLLSVFILFFVFSWLKMYFRPLGKDVNFEINNIVVVWWVNLCKIFIHGVYLWSGYYFHTRILLFLKYQKKTLEAEQKTKMLVDFLWQHNKFCQDAAR